MNGAPAPFSFVRYAVEFVRRVRRVVYSGLEFSLSRRFKVPMNLFHFRAVRAGVLAARLGLISLFALAVVACSSDEDTYVERPDVARAWRAVPPRNRSPWPPRRRAQDAPRTAT